MSKPPELETWTAIAGTSEIPALPLTTQLSLAPFVELKRIAGEIAEIEFGGRRIAFDADNRGWVTQVIDACDGRTISEVATEAGIEDDEALDLLQQLYHSAVMQNAGDGVVPALAFNKHIRSLTISFQVGLGEAMAKVGATTSRRIALGRLVEEYHFIMAAAEHISPAILSAPSPRLRMMYTEYLADEYWHGIWIRRGLNAADLDDATLATADPLPGTQAVIRYLQWAASDPLAYAVCVSAGENLGVTAESARKGYAKLVESGLVDEPVLAPFREHALYDLEQGHGSVAGEVYAELGPLTRAQQDSVRRAMMTYHHILFEQQLQIIAYYGDETAPIPFRVEQLPRLRALPTGSSPETRTPRIASGTRAMPSA